MGKENHVLNICQESCIRLFYKFGTNFTVQCVFTKHCLSASNNSKKKSHLFEIGVEEEEEEEVLFSNIFFKCYIVYLGQNRMSSE